MNKFVEQIKINRSIIGMIHVKALPGTPLNEHSIREIVQLAVDEAVTYSREGLDAIMLENMHDIPYLNNNTGPEIVAAMTVIATAVKAEVDLPCGIQILAGANKEALAVANTCDLDFIRVENYSYAHIADEGYMQSCAGELLRYRKNINAEHVAVFTDVKKKHSSHTITNDILLDEAIKTNEFFLSDGIIITGKSTGEKPLISDLHLASKTTEIPILVGSGITAENISSYWDLANGFIIGSYFKEQGYWRNKISIERINNLIKEVTRLRNNKKV